MNIRSTSTHLTHALLSAGHHWQTRSQKEKASAAPPFTIAISRQVGARGTSVAREVGTRLGWPVYDRELLEQIARDMKVRVDLVQCVDERKVGTIQECIEALLLKTPVAEGAYLRHLLDTVFALGTHGESVIVGRGSPQILPSSTTLRVRLVGTLEDRIGVMMKKLGVSRPDAVRYIETTEQERRRFIQDHFYKDSADPLYYDLVLNSSRFSDGECADLILLALARIQQRVTAETRSRRSEKAALNL